MEAVLIRMVAWLSLRQLSCLQGQCGEGADALANLAELGLSTTGAGGTGSGISLAAGSVAVVRAAEISLDCGDSLVSVPVGKSYAACQKVRSSVRREYGMEDHHR